MRFENPTIMNKNADDTNLTEAPKQPRVDAIENNEWQYTPEGIREEIHHKAEKIRAWAQELGMKEGEDFTILEDIRDVAKEGEQIAPHELKEFVVTITEDRYQQFRDYFTGRYAEERAQENPKGKVKLDYSWAGRFLVGWDGVPFDTVAAENLQDLRVNTHHKEFQSFFKQKTGFDFPSAEVLNPMLQEMANKGIQYYEEALGKLKILEESKQLPDDGYGLIDALEHALIILNNAKSGEAVIDLPDIITKEGMPPKMRHYADLTYNAEDLPNLDRVTEITGVQIPDNTRTDKIFDRYGFDRAKMEGMCKEFADRLRKIK